MELSKEMSFFKTYIKFLDIHEVFPEPPSLWFLFLNSCNVFCTLPVVFSGWGNGVQEHSWEGRAVVKVRKQEAIKPNGIIERIIESNQDTKINKKYMSNY